MNGTLVRDRRDNCVTTGTTPAGSYRIRLANPADEAGIREFLCGLSERSQYMRFFAGVAPPSTVLLRGMTGTGTARADILVITDDDGSVIGHGMAVDGAAPPGPLAADVGLVVADAWQDQGLGTTLLRTLVDRAVQRGIAELVFEVLPTNAKMLRIIARHWPDARRSRTPDSIAFTVRIGRGARRPNPAAA
jgi:ribosomal protein S18 acetylase RimI-like enzyme